MNFDTWIFLEKLSRELNFDVSLTVHFRITLANEQLDAQILNTFIIILYMYIFREISCSSSGGQIVLVLNFLSKQFFLNLCTGLSLTLSDDTRCCVNTILLPEDEQDIARNMYM